MIIIVIQWDAQFVVDCIEDHNFVFISVEYVHFELPSVKVRDTEDGTFFVLYEFVRQDINTIDHNLRFQNGILRFDIVIQNHKPFKVTFALGQ